MRISDWSSDVCSSDLHSLMDVAILPEIQRCKMETAGFHCADQAVNRSAARQPPVCLLETRFYDGAIMPLFLRFAIGFRRPRGRTRRHFPAKPCMGGGERPIYSRQGPADGFKRE